LFVILLLLGSSFSLKAVADKVAAKSTQDGIWVEHTSRIKALENTIQQLNAQINGLAGSGNSRYSSNGANSNYMYRDAIIYPDVFTAYNNNTFVKKGAAGSWDDTSYKVNPWNLRKILRIGIGAQSNGNGMLINVPDGYNVIWLRVLNDRWSTFRVVPVTNDGGVSYDEYTEVYAGGFRNLNEISPDGAAPDSQWNVHMWMPIPVRTVQNVMVYSHSNGDSWISGIAFGKNMWNHAKNSAVAYLWKLNPGTGDIGWSGENWNNDQLGYFPAGSNVEVSVPVVPTGGDKLIYMVEHNNNWTGTQHGGVFINGVAVERFRTTYLNPFAVHHNSKMYCRYMATRIPAGLISDKDRFVKLRIDMTMANQNIHFREIGTHDY